MLTKAFSRFITVFIIIFTVSACQSPALVEIPKTDEKTSPAITIFTTDPFLAIHTKMIVGNTEKIHLGSGKNTKIDRENLGKSDLVLSSTEKEKYIYSESLKNFSGIYTSIPLENVNNVIETLPELRQVINLILDALVVADPSNRGTYYDNAGNYIYRLENLFDAYSTRIKEYNSTPFVTIGSDYSSFILLYDLGRNHVAHYNTLQEFLSDPKWADEGNNNIIKTIFTSAITPAIREDVEKKYGVVIYPLSPLTDDTSAWGYLRYLEKVMNSFANAFDTYD